MAGSEQTSKVTAEQAINRTLPRTPFLPGKNIAEDFSRPSKRPRLEPPPPMTAAVAAADARQHSKSPRGIPASGSIQISPNPAAQALGALKGVSQNAMSQAYTPADSKPQDPTKVLSEGIATAIEHMQPRTTNTSASSTDQNVQTSPTSVTSFDASDSISAPAGAETTVASPLPIETPTQPLASNAATESISPDSVSPAMTFPAPLLQPQTSSERRGMSLPHSGLRQNTRSPSSRRHKCPFCSTEFTRHHNLKSHLLTHSQEKPFVCSTCQSRFRRLHDLKRHTKLHTGERPHVCPKCNRPFARGDALARHTKGPGGCAGRRASMSSFAGEDDYEGEDMEGVMYNEPESMEDVEGDASKGTPSIRRQAPSGDDTMDDPEHYSRIPSTYPPLQGRPPGGIASGQFPPRSGYAPPSSTSSSSMATTNAGPPQLPYPTSTSSSLRPHSGSQSGSQLYAQNPLTESPKPISPSQTQNRLPGSNDTRTHSPSVSHFQPPQSYNRAITGPSPSHSGSIAAPQLPHPHSLNPPDSRFTLGSQGTPTHPPTQPSGPPTHMSGGGPLSSNSNSLSSHGHSGHGSGENANSLFNKDERIWAVVKDLERKVTSMQEEINSLKSQLAAATAQQPPRP